MRIDRRAVLRIVLLLLPLAVALFDLSFWLALAAVLLWLAAGWAVTLAALASPRGPALELETIAASHFAEKVRWCLDRLGLAYEERVCGGALGAFFGGRTVPRLHVRTGAVVSYLGNSPEILRYLWGAYGEALGEQAAFLRPTPVRVRLEERLDAYGVDLQRWVYAHVLPHRAVTLRAWGVDDPRIPAWQRHALPLLFPLLRVLIRRAFAITPARVARSRERIEALLGELDARLAEAPGSLLPGGPDYTDLTLASLSALWLQPERFARGAGEHARLGRAAPPAGLAEDQARWRAAYPALVAHVEALYRER